MTESHARAVVLGLGVMVSAQLMGVLAKRALFEVPAFTFVWLQLAAAMVAMFVYTIVFRREWWPIGLPAQDWIAIVFIGLVNFGIVRLLMMMSIARLPINTFVFVLSFTGLVTMLISIVFLREKPGWIQVLGVVLAIFGVWLYFPERLASDHWTGVLLAIGIVALLATNNNVTRRLVTRQGDRLSSSQLSAIALPIGGVPIVLAGLVFDSSPAIGGLENGLIIAANGVVGIALTQTVFNQILKTLHSYEASVLTNSGLIWTGLLAIPILGEWLSFRQVVAIAVVIAGILLSQNRPVARR